MGQTVKAPDGTNWVVRRLILPAPISASHLAGSAVDSTTRSEGSPLIGLLVRGVLVGVIGLVVLPFAVVSRIAFRRWTVEATAGEQTTRWKAKTWGGAGAGVKAVAGAIDRGESLQQPFSGLTPLS